MEYTYDLNTNGVLILRADSQEREWLKELTAEKGFTIAAESEAMEPTLANSDLDWIAPEECGDLTDAPILGLRDAHGDAIDARWGYMNYAVRSFLQDLIETGEAIFTS